VNARGPVTPYRLYNYAQRTEAVRVIRAEIAGRPIIEGDYRRQTAPVAGAAAQQLRPWRRNSWATHDAINRINFI
jgi:hypothetical protein